MLNVQIPFCISQPYRHLFASRATLSYLDVQLLKRRVIVKCNGIGFEVFVVVLLLCNLLYCKLLLTSLLQFSLYILQRTFIGLTTASVLATYFSLLHALACYNTSFHKLAILHE